jgi:hypothetical protein
MNLVVRRLPLHISLRQANRYLLQRQHLLTPSSDPLQVVRDACGLQAQVPSTPALSLRARVANFQRADYEHMLVQDRTLVRTWAMRGTVHTLPTDQWPIYTQVYAHPDGISEAAQLALDLLKAGPQSRSQLAARAIAERGVAPAQAELLFGPWGGILPTLARAGHTVHAPSVGADVPVVRVEDWLRVPQTTYPMSVLEDQLLQAYLHGYGPATMQDFAHFTNFKVGRTKEVFARAPHLAEVHLEGSNLVHYLHEADLPALLAVTGQEEAPVQLLPRFDSLVLIHKQKDRLMDGDARRHIFGAGAQVEAVVLIDGRVAGTWKAKLTSRTLQVQFNPFGDQPTESVAAEARRLADWYGIAGLSLTVKSEGPQASVAARKERVEAVGTKLRAPRLAPAVALVERLRTGQLVHIPALPGLVVPPAELQVSVTAHLNWLAHHGIRVKMDHVDRLELRPISADLAPVNAKPTHLSTALIDSDLAPLTDVTLKLWGKILRAAATEVTPTDKHLQMLSWYIGRCTDVRRRLVRGATVAAHFALAIEDVLTALAASDRGQFVERAGEAWTPRKVLRRTIQYLLEQRPQGPATPAGT